MIKPIIIDSEQLNGLDWNISKNLKKKFISVPQENIMYKTINGDYNLRFSKYQNHSLIIESNLEISDD